MSEEPVARSGLDQTTGASAMTAPQEIRPATDEEIADYTEYLNGWQTYGDIGAMERLVEMAPSVLARISSNRAEIDRLRKPCTCGSGAHPRFCDRHPEWKERHVFEINYEAAVEAEKELTAENDRLRARVAELEEAIRRYEISAGMVGVRNAELERLVKLSREDSERAALKPEPASR